MPVMGGDRADAGLVVALLGPVEIGPAGSTMTPVARPRLRVLLGLLAVVEGRMVTGAALAEAAGLCARLDGEADRLEEARLAVAEERIGCDLALGRHGEVAAELA